MTEEGWKQGADKKSRFYDDIEILIKGPEEKLPDGESYPDAQGVERTKARISWWNENPKTNAEAYASLPEGAFAKKAFNGAREESLSGLIARDLRSMPKDQVIFIGHIWLTGEPAPLSNRVICVDYSVAKGDKLVAWRMADANKPGRGYFVSVPAGTAKVRALQLEL